MITGILPVIILISVVGFSVASNQLTYYLRRKKLLFNWKIEPVDGKSVQRLRQSLHISEILASVLIRRGIDDPQEARYFLFADRTHLQSPEYIPGLNDAARRIQQAIMGGERIVIYGDYDVDGICGTVILLECLQNLGAKVDYYIPDRFDEGYGLNCEAVEKLASQGIHLLITVDCGINSVQEIARASELGMEVIVTDHHTPESVLPDAAAIVNPHLGAPDKMRDLCGAGVVFKLVQRLGRGIIANQQFNDWIELAAMATIADIVPLRGENRILVKEGLNCLRQTRRPGLKALIEESRSDGESLQAYHLGFILAPRINAAGRLQHASLAVDLLMAKEESAARRLARELCRLNEERRRIEQAVVDEAAACVDRMEENLKKGILMVEGEGWHPGVIGIAASRLAELYGLPVVLISWEGELGRGSARSIPGFDLYEALYACQDTLEKFGGHAMAAGLSLKRSQLKEFRQLLQEQASLVQTGGEAVTYLDGEIFSHQITMDLARELEMLKPFGEGNPVPLFLIHHSKIERASLMGSDRSHFRAVLQPGNIPVISFRRSEWIEYPFRQCRFDLLGHLEINSYQEKFQVQVKAAHLEPSYKNPAAGCELKLQNILDETVRMLRCGKPAVFVFPTYRLLCYYYKFLSTLLLPEAVCLLHGHLPPQERLAAETALSSGHPLVFLLTESFCQHLRKKSGHPYLKGDYMVKFWPLAAESADCCFNRCYPDIKDQPRVKLSSNINSFPDHTLLYINSQASRANLNQQWTKLTKRFSVSDWTFSEALPAGEPVQDNGQAEPAHFGWPKADQVVLVDPPYSCYEALVLAQQVTPAPSAVVLQAEFTPRQLMTLEDNLQQIYPDRTIIAKTAACLAKLARQGLIQEDLQALTARASQAAGLKLNEQQLLSSLRTMSDLGLCLYRKKGSIIEIKMLNSPSATLDLADSPFYREGQMEKRAFDRWKQWVIQELAW